MKWLADIVSGLIPNDESDAQSLRVYRLRLALVACSAWLVVSLVLLPALFVGLPMIGQVAWSDDVKARIAESVLPIQQDIEALQLDIQAATAAMNAAIAETVYQEVLQLARQRCATTDARERDRLSTLIRARQVRYRQLSGDASYSAPTCADL